MNENEITPSLEEVLAVYKKEEALCRKRGDQDGLLASYENQAQVFQHWGRLEEAMAMLKKQEALCLQLDHPRGLPRTYERQAKILHSLGRPDDALAVLERGLADIAEHLNDDASYLTRLLWMQLSVLPAARGGEEVVRLADEVVDRLRDSDEPSTRLTLALALVQKFLALGMLGRPSESSAAAEAAHEYPEEALQVLDQQISAIDHDTDPSSGANFATRQMLRASILISLDRDEEGVEVLDSLIKQFAHADDPVGLELLKQARIARADLDLDE